MRPEVLEPVEGTLDAPAKHRGALRSCAVACDCCGLEWPAWFRVHPVLRAIRRYHRPCRQHPFRRFDPADQAFCDRAVVVRLTSGQQNGDQAPLSICECVYLRVAPSARAPNSLLLLPPFPPAA
jgi:hypothetical protein